MHRVDGVDKLKITVVKSFRKFAGILRGDVLMLVRKFPLFVQMDNVGFENEPEIFVLIQRIYYLKWLRSRDFHRDKGPF